MIWFLIIGQILVAVSLVLNILTGISAREHYSFKVGVVHFISGVCFLVSNFCAFRSGSTIFGLIFIAACLCFMIRPRGEI